MNDEREGNIKGFNANNDGRPNWNGSSTNSDFVFTFARADISGNKSRDEELTAIDNMMTTGMTHAGIVIRPLYSTDMDLNGNSIIDYIENTQTNLDYLRDKEYKLALNIHAGRDSYERKYWTKLGQNWTRSKSSYQIIQYLQAVINR